MNFRILTLIDVTETGENHGANEKLINQQANWNTVVQVIGLRANPTPIKTESDVDSISKLGFGSAYKGKHRYWIFDFEIEYGETTLDNLALDFDLVPIITGLDETVKIKTPMFVTEDAQHRNIIFWHDNDWPTR